MKVEAREETPAPRGVIGCLTAGFELVGRNLELVAVPVLLDLLLWLGPRVSVAPLLLRFLEVMRDQPVSDPGTVRQVAQAAQLLEQFGERFNLLSLLSGVPLLHVPSLLARHAPGKVLPLGEPRVFSITRIFALVPSWAGLVVVGLALGIVYLNGVAQRVQTGGTPAGAETEQATRVMTVVGRFIRLLLFEAGLLVVGAVLSPLLLLLVAAATVIAQPVGVVVWALGVGLAGYTAVHLVFVIPGVLLGGRQLLRAIWESIALSRTQLSSVMGLVMLAVVIYEGLGYAWSLPSGESWSLLIGILGNAAVATGLTAATFVFYEERLANGSS